MSDTDAELDITDADAELDITDADAEALLADAVDADEPDESGVDDTGASSDVDDTDTDDPRLARARRDAAGYRERLRAAEAERDALREELAGHRTNEIVRLAESAGMRSGADLLAVTSVEALKDPETGRVDPSRVQSAAADAIAARPHWRRPAKLPRRPEQRLRGTGDDPESQEDVSWAAVLQRGR